MKNIVLVLNEDNLPAFIAAVSRGPHDVRAAMAAMLSSRHGEMSNVIQAWNVMHDMRPCFGPPTQRLRDVTMVRLQNRGAGGMHYSRPPILPESVAPMTDPADPCADCDVDDEDDCEGCIHHHG